MCSFLVDCRQDVTVGVVPSLRGLRANTHWNDMQPVVLEPSCASRGYMCDVHSTCPGLRCLSNFTLHSCTIISIGV